MTASSFRSAGKLDPEHGEGTYSPAQKALVETPGSLFVEACPGSGKTKAIVGRFLRRIHAEPRKGVALLSFTNAAVDEARRRSAAPSGVVRSPHFIGTFDAFINRMLVTPIYTARYQRPVRYVDTWNGISMATARVTGVAGEGFSLEFFRPDVADLACTLEADRIPAGSLRTRASTLSDDQRGQLEKAALEQLIRIATGKTGQPPTGILNAEMSRHLARHWLGTSEWGPLIIDALAGRFAEVIVDEAQDCDPDELAILASLHQAGIDIVMVGDLDQAIYEFRQSQPSLVWDATRRLPQGERLHGNYRSAPAICATVATLRTSDQTDEPRGPHRDSDAPVHLAGFRNLAQVRDLGLAVAGTHHIPDEQIVVLAHRTTDAARAAGAPVPSSVASQNRVVLIAKAALKLRDPTCGPSARVGAAEAIAVAMMEVTGHPKGGFALTELAEHGIAERWLRNQAVRLAFSLDPAAMDAASYTTALRSHLMSIPWPHIISSNGIKRPKDEAWQAVAGESTSVTPLSFSTVHAAKGLQFPMVILVIPRRPQPDSSGLTCLDLWEQRVNGESKRVLYVAASRAEQVLLIAAHEDHHDRLKAILAGNGVPHQLM